MGKDDEVEIFETEEDLEQALAEERGKEIQKTGGSAPGGVDLQKLSDLTNMTEEQRATAQAVLYTTITGGFVKGVSKAFNGNKPLGPKLMVATGIIGAIGAGGLTGLLFGKKK